MKSEDLSQIESDLTHIAGSEQASSLFKVTDANSFRDSEQGATTSMECYNAAVSGRGTEEDSNHGTSVIGQSSLQRQATRTARIGKAASLAVLMASHKDTTKCDSA